MDTVITKDNSALKKNNHINTTKDESSKCEYVIGFYEIFEPWVNKIWCIFHKNFDGQEKDIRKWTPEYRNNQWKKRIVFVIFIYIMMEAIFNLFCLYFPDNYFGPSLYKYAGLVLGTILFWPLVIVYDSETFYEMYLQLKPLFGLGNNPCEWYQVHAKGAFQLASDFKKIKEDKNIWEFVYLFVNALCIITLFVTYFLLLLSKSKGHIAENDLFQKINFTEVIKSEIVITIFLSGLSYLLADYNKNLHTTLFIMDGGLSYYIYLLNFSHNSRPAIVDQSYTFVAFITVLTVILLFFIIGSAVYPMYRIFKVFFISDFVNELFYPIENILDFSDRIHLIKRYFQQLTIICLIAYFQLLLSAILLDLINSESITTVVFFVCGSFFPMILFLSSSVFFKMMTQKIYLKQIDKKEMDKNIKDAIDRGDSDKLQRLIKEKELYTEELETKVFVKREILAAVITPIITAILGVVFGIGIN